MVRRIAGTAMGRGRTIKRPSAYPGAPIPFWGPMRLRRPYRMARGNRIIAADPQSFDLGSSFHAFFSGARRRCGIWGFAARLSTGTKAGRIALRTERPGRSREPRRTRTLPQPEGASHLPALHRAASSLAHLMLLKAWGDLIDGIIAYAASRWVTKPSHLSTRRRLRCYPGKARSLGCHPRLKQATENDSVPYP